MPRRGARRADPRARPAGAAGRWTTDVSPWVAGWIIGVEWDPTGCTAPTGGTRPRHRAGPVLPQHPGREPTERWLARAPRPARHARADRGVSMPLAFANWPTTDPLRHPTSRFPQEDLAGVDANHVGPPPPGQAAPSPSYHAYPYYPDFQRHEPALQRRRRRARDPYAGYLEALREHHGSASRDGHRFGVPSSIGTAHSGPLGRDQGGHCEHEAMRIDAELLRLIHGQGLAGGFLFSWIDEWFKLTWNTVPPMRPRRSSPALARRAGRTSSVRAQGGGRRRAGPSGQGRRGEPGRGARGEARPDPSWLHLRIRLDRPAEGTLGLGFDLVPGGADELPGSGARDGASDYAVVLDLERRSGQAFVRGGLEPLYLDFSPLPAGVIRSVDGGNEMLLSTNREQTIPTTGETLPYETFDVGVLRHGTWDSTASDYDSRATWRANGHDVVLRIPWLQLGVIDPSSHRALVPVVRDGVPIRDGPSPFRRVTLRVVPSRGEAAVARLAWDGWNRVQATERLKAGYEAYADALREVSRETTPT